MDSNKTTEIHVTVASWDGIRTGWSLGWRNQPHARVGWVGLRLEIGLHELLQRIKSCIDFHHLRGTIKGVLWVWVKTKKAVSFSPETNAGDRSWYSTNERTLPFGSANCFLLLEGLLPWFFFALSGVLEYLMEVVKVLVLLYGVKTEIGSAPFSLWRAAR